MYDDIKSLHIKNRHVIRSETLAGGIVPDGPFCSSVIAGAASGRLQSSSSRPTSGPKRRTLTRNRDKCN